MCLACWKKTAQAYWPYIFVTKSMLNSLSMTYNPEKLIINYSLSDSSVPEPLSQDSQLSLSYSVIVPTRKWALLVFEGHTVCKQQFGDVTRTLAKTQQKSYISPVDCLMTGLQDQACTLSW